MSLRQRGKAGGGLGDGWGTAGGGLGEGWAAPAPAACCSLGACVLASLCPREPGRFCSRGSPPACTPARPAAAEPWGARGRSRAPIFLVALASQQALADLLCQALCPVLGWLWGTKRTRLGFTYILVPDQTGINVLTPCHIFRVKRTECQRWEQWGL